MTVLSTARLLGAICVLASAAASAATWNGRLDDPANGWLVASDLSPASFGSESEIANNVALLAFQLSTEGPVTIASSQFAVGGIDPYFTLFVGAGSTATFLASNYAQAFSDGGDFVYSAILSKGAYQVAIGAFANLSFAENQGGTLADGFIGLGEPSSLGDASYRIEITTPVPEPASAALLAAGWIVLSWARLQRNRTSDRSVPNR